MMNRLKQIPSVVVAIAIILAALALVFYENEYLWKVQELNLFLLQECFSASKWWCQGDC